MSPQSAARRATYLRLSFFYGSFFFMAGLMMPYWPLWLSSRGLGTAEIGFVLSAAYWAKVVAQPLVARRADRLGETRGLMVGLSLSALVLLAACDRAAGFWPLLILVGLLGAAYQPVLPLAESVSLRRVREAGLDYGRVRLWGSITFIVAAAAGGVWLEGQPAGSLLWLVFGAQALVVLACLAMPLAARVPSAVRLRDVAIMLADRRFLLFLLTASSIQTSHVIVYGFGALYWQGAGLAESTIGILWAAGVVAEIVLFAWIGRHRDRFTSASLLGLGAIGGLVRWPLTALTVDPTALVAIQCLHALTFGATHLAAMAFLLETVPERLAATGQALYATIVGGIAMGLALPIGAWLYGHYQGGAFYVMAAACLVGLGGAVALARTRARGSG